MNVQYLIDYLLKPEQKQVIIGDITDKIESDPQNIVRRHFIRRVLNLAYKPMILTIVVYASQILYHRLFI